MVTKEHGKVFAVLNMANAYVAGGGYVEGMPAQEENMFRRTDCHYFVTYDPLPSLNYRCTRLTLSSLNYGCTRLILASLIMAPPLYYICKKCADFHTFMLQYAEMIIFFPAFPMALLTGHIKCIYMCTQ